MFKVRLRSQSLIHTVVKSSAYRSLNQMMHTTQLNKGII